jgi:hypothetical protein
MLLQNSAMARRWILVDFILKGSNTARSQGERSRRRLGEILDLYRDPFVSKMRNAAHRASKSWRCGQIRVLQQNWRHPAAERL